MILEKQTEVVVVEEGIENDAIGILTKKPDPGYI